MRAVANVVADLLWGERHLRGRSLTNIRLEIKFFELESMSNVLTAQHEHNRLSLFQRDLGWDIYVKRFAITSIISGNASAAGARTERAAHPIPTTQLR